MIKRQTKPMDGNTAAAYVSYAFTEVAAIYPITPSSVMADKVDKYAASGKKNIFDTQVTVTQMQSEAGVAGAIHGALTAGALATTYTSSQGLLLMIPNMYKMAGELLPSVIHVAARTIATHALSILGDHSDIYACRQTGYAMLCANNPQEVMHLGAVAHLASIKSRVPFLHFFDGFRTSHEIQKIELLDYNELAEMLDLQAVQEFRNRALNPNHPVVRGTTQNDDVFFQAREASNKFYDEVPNTVINYMNEINSRTGSDYKPFNYYGAADATKVIVAMGSVCETIEEVIDYLIAKGEKVGLVKVRLYRPFVANFLKNALPKTVEKISVLDRTKESGSIGEPLYLDVLAALNEFCTNMKIYSGRYGLSSKDTTPAQIFAVYENMDADDLKKRFTIGINDDVTHLSLEEKENIDTTAKETYSCKFWGLGADGTVGATKNSAKIIGNNLDLNVQAYFSYDSKKSGGVTISHLRFGPNPIKSMYCVNRADFVACHNTSYIFKYDILKDLKLGGKFLLNCSWSKSELEQFLPNKIKKFIAHNNIDFYIIDAKKINCEIGLGGRINTVLQASFFKIINIIEPEQAVEYMKNTVTETYKNKGEKTVNMNHQAIEAGINGVQQINVPALWKNLNDEPENEITTDYKSAALQKYTKSILNPLIARKGDELPVSAFLDYVDGTIPLGSSAHEKRGVASSVPEWIPANCIQCNICSYVCPHAVICPAVMTSEELKNAPESMPFKKMTGFPDLNFAITVSNMDCTGCGNCVQVCPGMKNNKALVMKPFTAQSEGQKTFDYATKLPIKTEVFEKFKETTVKGSQFKKPLMEFPGACAGCGETPYAKLATQLFGDRMLIANATGCSSIWGASSPSTPYTTNEKGQGPAWQNSLFEDNAEFGYGMALAQNSIRKKLIEYVKQLKGNTYHGSCCGSSDMLAKNIEFNERLNHARTEYLATLDNSSKNKIASEKLINILEDSTEEFAQKILENKDYLSKKSVWMFGGDGWSYDIGFGGLDHVIASGEDVNILIFDTEVYSNTGGQASKATPYGATAQFAALGKITPKKNLAAIAMTYGYVYVAQVAIGADYNQCIKALTEAESYSGPSIIISYSPCINHGIKSGMVSSSAESKLAVESGYWHLFRFDPRAKEKGESPLKLDSKPPKTELKNFLLNEARFNTFAKSSQNKFEENFAKLEASTREKYKTLDKLSTITPQPQL